MDDQQAGKLLTALGRMADALEAASGTGAAKPPENWAASRLWIWQAAARLLKPVLAQKAMPSDHLVGIDDQKEALTANTAQFAKGYSANNALLWGARGMGKSSLVRAVHTELSVSHPLHLIEIYRDDLGTLPILTDLLATQTDKRFILFCDDLSFDGKEAGYKSLKALLDGGITARPDNILFYATSNRRHIVSRDMIENEQGTAIHPGESVEEKVSLSDRFGLWLGFYPCSQDQYLEMVKRYAAAYGLNYTENAALEWFRTRGSRSGRVAWQFIQDEAGRQQRSIA